MRKFTLSRKAWAVLPAAWRALAIWPLAAAACSVYDDTLVNGVSAPLGGDAGSSAGGTASGAAAGSSLGGAAGSSSAGSESGKAGDTPGGGGAGTSGGGAAGSAGSMTGGAGAGGEAPDDAVLVDDMEDGDAGIVPDAGRNGYWYASGDATKGATITPPSTKFAMTQLTADRSSYAASLKAVGFTDWGSVLGFNFVELAGDVKAYDASMYCGVRFWGKAAANASVRFRVPDGNTHPKGLVCTDGGVSGQACYDHFGATLTFAPTWKQFTQKFSALEQIGTGYHPADGKLRVDKLYGLEWALPGKTGNTYQIWIDDVELLKCP
jgi:hypothetical protein